MMKIRHLLFSQILVCFLFVSVFTYNASAAVTIDFRYGIQDGANGTNGVLLKLQIELGGKVEEIFASETKEVGTWAEPQSIEIPSEFIGKNFTLIWVIDPLGNINSDWFVIEDPWVVVNGVNKYSFFDKYDDAEYTTVDVKGVALLHGAGKAGRDAMWNDAGALFVQLPWSKDHGFAVIPDSVGKVPCKRTIFCHPPQKGPTNGGTEAIKFNLGSAQISVESKRKLMTIWGYLKFR